IAETAGLVTEVPHLAIFKIQDLNRFDGLGNFLTVGADILYGCRAHASGNSAEALDTRAIGGDGAGYELVPVFSCADVEPRLPALFHSADCDFHNQPGPAGIRDQEITSAAQYEKRQLMRLRECNSVANFVEGFCLQEITRRSAHAESGQRSQRH